jgi:hypothetical protein
MTRRDRQPEYRPPTYKVYDPQTGEMVHTDTPPRPGEATASGQPDGGFGVQPPRPQQPEQAAQPPVGIPCLIVPREELTGTMGRPDEDGNYRMTGDRYAVRRSSMPEFCRPPSERDQEAKNRKGRYPIPADEFVIVPNRQVYKEMVLGGRAILQPITQQEFAAKKAEVEERNRRKLQREAERQRAALRQSGAGALAVRNPRAGNSDTINRALTILEALVVGQGAAAQSELFGEDHEPRPLPSRGNNGSHASLYEDDLLDDDQGYGGNHNRRPDSGRSQKRGKKPSRDSGDYSVADERKKPFYEKHKRKIIAVSVIGVLALIATGAQHDGSSQEASASVSGGQKDAAAEAAREHAFVYDSKQAAKLQVGGLAVKATFQLGMRYSGLKGQPYGWMPSQAVEDAKGKPYASNAPYVATTDQHILFGLNASDQGAVTAEQVANAAVNTTALTIHVDKIAVGAYLDKQHPGFKVDAKPIDVKSIPAKRASWQRIIDATPSAPTAAQAQTKKDAQALLSSTPTPEQATGLNNFVIASVAKREATKQVFVAAGGVAFAAELKNIDADPTAEQDLADMVVQTMKKNLAAQNAALNKINHTNNKITFNDPEGQLNSPYVGYLASVGLKESSNQAGVLEYVTAKGQPVPVRIYNPTKQVNISEIK